LTETSTSYITSQKSKAWYTFNYQSKVVFQLSGWYIAYNKFSQIATLDSTDVFEIHFNCVALRNATMAIGRSRRPRGPTYARGANRSQFEDPELAVNARHLATRRAHPAFKFFTSLIPEAESFNLESFVPATTGGLEEHMLPPQMSG
jgi:hypothetical protein